MKKSLKLGEVIFKCSFCKKDYLVNTLARGRLKKYCSDACKTKAYRHRSGQLGKKFKAYFLEGQKPKTEKFKRLSDYEQQAPKPREKRASFIKRRIDIEFRGYLSLVKQYNKLFKLSQSENSLLDISELQDCFSMLKGKKVEQDAPKIKAELSRLKARYLD